MSLAARFGFAAFIFLIIAHCPLVRSRKRTVTTTGYTVKDSACQTSCTNHNDKYNYCYLGWGSSNWDYCDPNLNGAQVTQPLGQSKGKSTDKACTSFCSGEGPLWCFAGSETSDCAPDPLPELTLQILAKGLKKCNKKGRRVPRQGPAEDEIREYGVQEVIEKLTLLFSDRVVQHDRSAETAITQYLTILSPSVAGMRDNEPLPLFLSARIERRHRMVREVIPTFISRRMDNMNFLTRQDEQGHLLAASLGGPTTDYNFVPQLRTVNRHFEGERSYWFELEREMRDFLDDQNNIGPYIYWDVVVVYEDLIHGNRRPTGFGIEAVFFANNSRHHETGTNFISNEPSDLNVLDCMMRRSP